MKKKMPAEVKEALNGKKRPKEADGVRKRHVTAKGEAHEEGRGEEEEVRKERKTRVLKKSAAPAKPPLGVQGRCVLNPNGVDLSKGL